MKQETKHYLRLIGVLLLCTALGVHTQLQAQGSKQLREGDLLFVAKEGANAITAVTQGVNSLQIDHVAIYTTVGGEGYALEAIDRGVTLSPLRDFLRRIHSKEGKGRLVVGRVVEKDFDAKASIRNAIRQMGKPYDSLFMPGDEAFYCSELVQKSYVRTSGEMLFSPIPMTFRDASGEIHEHWTKLYAEHQLSVPEGEPGSNPGDLSRRTNVRILHGLGERITKALMK